MTGPLAKALAECRRRKVTLAIARLDRPQRNFPPPSDETGVHPTGFHVGARVLWPPGRTESGAKHLFRTDRFSRERDRTTTHPRGMEYRV
jgi:hypothetical protein